MPTSAMLALFAMLAAGCGALGGGGEVAGYPDVDLGADLVEVYKTTDQRDLHLHVFPPDDANVGSLGAILFFHGGGFRNTRVAQFEHQAQAAADAGFVGVIAEYRVTAEGTTREDAIVDGADALRFVQDNASSLGVDPQLSLIHI